MPALANRLKVVQDPKSLLWKWERTETVEGRTITRYGTAATLEEAIAQPTPPTATDDPILRSGARKRLSVLFDEETGRWRWSVRHGKGAYASLRTGSAPTMLEALQAGEDLCTPPRRGRQPART